MCILTVYVKFNLTILQCGVRDIWSGFILRAVSHPQQRPQAQLLTAKRQQSGSKSAGKQRKLHVTYAPLRTMAPPISKLGPLWDYQTMRLDKHGCSSLGQRGLAHALLLPPHPPPIPPSSHPVPHWTSHTASSLLHERSCLDKILDGALDVAAMFEH
mmetsp:Transcript_70390/g.139530  ORF Transcript_70390/g.139530 Transcript_70390/m.139530 type:complete len:157 (-) Transcript_70390:991-1461(-)